MCKIKGGRVGNMGIARVLQCESRVELDMSGVLADEWVASALDSSVADLLPPALLPPNQEAICVGLVMT
jgi:hypothetical protein